MIRLNKNIITGLVIVVGVYGWMNYSGVLQTEAPEAYKNPYYCEKDSDCKYTISASCCTPGVINKYHNPEDFPIIPQLCTQVCNTNAKRILFCDIVEKRCGANIEE